MNRFPIMAKLVTMSSFDLCCMFDGVDCFSDDFDVLMSTSILRNAVVRRTS